MHRNFFSRTFWLVCALVSLLGACKRVGVAASSQEEDLTAGGGAGVTSGMGAASSAQSGAQSGGGVESQVMVDVNAASEGAAGELDAAEDQAPEVQGENAGSEQDAGEADNDLLPEIEEPAAASDVACDFEHELPVVCIDVSEADLALLLEDPQAEIEVPAAVVFDGEYFDDVEFELHGGFARTLPKKSFRVTFKGARPEVDLFGDGVESLKRLVLQASWIDPTWLRAKLTMDLTRIMGGLAPRISHVILYVNGQYAGLYLGIERIDGQFLRRNGLRSGGDLYKAETLAANWDPDAELLAGFATMGNSTDDGSRLSSLFQDLHAMSPVAADYQHQVAQRLATREWEAWHLVHSYAENVDTFRKNYYLYHDATAVPGTVEDRYRVIMWDADATWGNGWNGAAISTDSRAWYGNRNLFAKAYFSDGLHLQAYLMTYELGLQSELRPELLHAAVDERALRIAQEADRDLAHWQRELGFFDVLADLHTAIDARHEVMTEVVAGQLARIVE